MKSAQVCALQAAPVSGKSEQLADEGAGVGATVGTSVGAGVGAGVLGAGVEGMLVAGTVVVISALSPPRSPHMQQAAATTG